MLHKIEDNTIKINSVFELNDENRIRIIDINTSGKVAVYVDMGANFSVPKTMPLGRIKELISQGELWKVEDPYCLVMTDSMCNEKEIAIRDKRYEIVSKYWNEKREDLIYHKNQRIYIYKKIAEDERISINLVRRMFTRFWQRGMNLNSMCPSYYNSGAKGKERRLSKTAGRKRSKSDVSTQMPITDKDKNNIEKIINDFYYKGVKMKSIRACYYILLEKYYSYADVEAADKAGRLYDKYPSEVQFKYWFERLVDPDKRIEGEKGKSRANLESRMLTGSVSTEAEGIGFRYQIDATEADVYLISKENKNVIVGRPTVYFAVDVFSRLITGVDVSLEKPSWNSAMRLIDNILTDKRTFASKHNVEIDEYNWPCKYLPQYFMTDRGEFEGKNAGNLTKLGIKVENSAPYHGDQKGIVERLFNTLNKTIKEELPGAVIPIQKQVGDRDYRLDARLTLDDFIQYVIYFVIKHNQNEVQKMKPTLEMQKNGVSCIPCEIWDWCIKENNVFMQDTSDVNKVRLNILPRGNALFIRKGLKFKGMTYLSSYILKNKYYDQKQKRSMEVAYDPNSTNNIYIILEEFNSYDIATLCNDDMKYANMTFNAAEEQRLRPAKANSKRKSKEELNVEMRGKVSKLIEEANKSYEEDKDNTVTKTHKIKNIKAAREDERKKYKKTFELGAIIKADDSKVVEFQKTNENISVEPDKDVMDELFSKYWKEGEDD